MMENAAEDRLSENRGQLWPGLALAPGKSTIGMR